MWHVGKVKSLITCHFYSSFVKYAERIGLGGRKVGSSLWKGWMGVYADNRNSLYSVARG